MNKYKLALKYIEESYLIPMCDYDGCFTPDEELNILKELVEKETPMEPIENAIEGSESEFECGFCGDWIREPFNKDYCPYCGHRIDWSEYK